LVLWHLICIDVTDFQRFFGLSISMDNLVLKSAMPVADPAEDLVLRLSMARGLNEIMDAVRAESRALVEADGITFVLRDGNERFYADEDAITPLWKGQRFAATTCISGWAMMHRQVVVTEDIYADDRIPHSVIVRPS
jgi:hypothetical protein